MWRVQEWIPGISGLGLLFIDSCVCLINLLDAEARALAAQEAENSSSSNNNNAEDTNKEEEAAPAEETAEA